MTDRMCQPAIATPRNVPSCFAFIVLSLLRRQVGDSEYGTQRADEDEQLSLVKRGGALVGHDEVRERLVAMRAFADLKEVPARHRLVAVGAGTDLAVRLVGESAEGRQLRPGRLQVRPDP